MDLHETETQPPSYEELAEAVHHQGILLSAEIERSLTIEEALSDLELSAENVGWRVMAAELEREFSRDGLARVAENCGVMAIASPMIKRGLLLRIGYIWGQGYTIQARAGKDATQDVNGVVQSFWDDESNAAALTSSMACETNERTLGTKGNVFFAFFPNPLTGRVQVRTTPFEEIQDKITNPEDRDEVWFYLRQYTATVIEPGYEAGTTRRRTEVRRVLHPALGYWPGQRPHAIDRLPILWDQPILHVHVNKPEGWKWGVPDAYAALPWARAYEGFLTDWARLVKSLSKFAWRLTGDKASRAKKAAEKLASSFPGRADVEATLRSVGTTDSTAGQVAAGGPGVSLEAIPKSGATIDAQSGKPLAAMVAAALGVSVVDLLADPGITGARAVAETLDKPIVLEMGMRRELWDSVLKTVASYVVDQAVRAPRGPLKGTVVRDPFTGRDRVTLAGDVERTVEISWPKLDELDPVQLISAIVDADSTKKIPPLEIAKLLCHALGIDDVDELLEDLTDEEGNWVDPYASAGQAAVDDFRRGQDPADRLR